MTARTDTADRKLEPGDFFTSEKWHRPYAEALLETDPIKLPARIVEAEHAIFVRYLELCISPGSQEQSLDLERAVGALIELKQFKLGWKVELRTAKSRTIVYCPIPDDVAGTVINQPAKYPFWTGESNAEDCAATWRKAFARLFKQVGIEGHIHQFRHTFAKRLLLSGTPMETVSQLGHKKTEVTQRHYNKWILERQQNMEAVVRNSWSRIGHAKKTDC